MATRKIGDWGAARRILSSGARNLTQAIDKTLMMEALLYQRELKVGLRTQSPGGKKFKKLAKSTRVGRKFKNFGGTKALIRSGDLRNSITIVKRRQAVFIGIPRTAKGKDGRNLVNIAKVHEFGSRPIIIKITPAMQKFLAAMFAGARGRSAGGGRAGGGGVLVVQIPARPFMRPVFLKLRKGSQKRVMRVLGRSLAGAMGRV